MPPRVDNFFNLAAPLGGQMQQQPPYVFGFSSQPPKQRSSKHAMQPNILPNSECQRWFADLPKEVQNEVLRKRLNCVENHEFISD